MFILQESTTEGQLSVSELIILKMQFKPLEKCPHRSVISTFRQRAGERRAENTIFFFSPTSKWKSV